MSSYGYEREPPRTYVREERREERVDPRYADSRAEYTRTYSRDLVPRARESSDLSIEEVRREFPPPQARDIRRTRSAEPNYYDDDDDYYDYRRDHDRRSKKTSTTMSIYREERHAPKHRSMSKQEKIIAAVAGAALLAGGKELYDRREAQQEGSSEIHRNPLASVALAGIGALAAYQGAQYYNKVQARKDQKAVAILNRGYYDSDDDMSTKEKKGQKNFLESAIAATGLGAAVKSLTGKGDGDKTRSGEPRSGGNKMQKAAMASLLAGATEAFRVAKEPGGWKGEKTRRILTAAAGAATIDSAQNKDHGKIGLAESVIGGLVGNRLINGSKNDIEEDKKTGRSRSRSRARSSSRDGGSGGTGLAALASAGLGAFGAKAAYDTYQNRSRSRAGSDDSRGRGDSPDRRRSRSRSVVDKARNSLAKLGIGNGTDDDRRHTQDDFDDRGSRRPRRYSDEYDDDYRSNRGRDYYDDRDRSYRSRHGGDHHYDSDLGDSDDDEKKHKKMRGKSVLISGLAAVATIHAAHSIYKGVEKRAARETAVREGKLSTEEAAKLRNKALLQDAASVGLAALGIKGAIGEFKEAKELSHECKEFKKEKAERHQKRIEARKQRTAPSTRQQSPNNWSSGQQHQYPESDEEDYYYHEVARTYERPQRANTLPPRPY
ncbi:unnamed protein product [Clonostachys rosea f. rosea IK726]|uniref:Uncharacterized protein n=1 Tax=Clonostachys rosea f. rosea IK726 TaxID=1349383 RepID=A0ACA9TFF6_BIOOC|nr:unnamed protein product [Clonostachys rosea f. rosea IK726]